MACVNNHPYNDSTSMEELVGALRDLQSFDCHNLMTNCSQEYNEMKERCHRLEREMNCVKREFEKLFAEKTNIEKELSRTKNDLAKIEQAWLEKTEEKSSLRGVHQKPISEHITVGQSGFVTLAKRYTELYDKEWPNVFDLFTIKFNLDEKTAILSLREILEKCHKYAIEMSQKQMIQAERILTGSSNREAGVNCRNLLRNAQMHVDINQADELLKEFLETCPINIIPETGHVIQNFAAECFQVCWIMSIQDPPAAFAEDPAQDDYFDTNSYIYYTASGDRIEMIVWPALLIHEKGPVLAKGIAKTFSQTRSVSASTTEQCMQNKNLLSNTSRLIKDQKYGTEATYGTVTTTPRYQGQCSAETRKQEHQGQGGNDKTTHGLQGQVHAKATKLGHQGQGGVETTKQGHQVQGGAETTKQGYQRHLDTETIQQEHQGQWGAETTKHGHQGQRGAETTKHGHQGQRGAETTEHGHQGQWGAETTEHGHQGQCSVKTTEQGYQGQWGTETTKHEHQGQCGAETTKEGHQGQNDSVISSNQHNYYMITQTGGGYYGVSSPTRNASADRFQLSQQHQTQRIDWQRFQHFCQCLRFYDETQLRNIFGSDFDLYYSYYKNMQFPVAISGQILQIDDK